MTSDTPRTDKALLTYTGGEYVTFPRGLRCVVDADFARQLERELAAVTAERDAMKEDAERIRIGLGFVLDPQVINSDNIGDIRRSLFLPINCQWNDIVREETAARENKPPRHPDDVQAAIDAARKDKL